MNMLATTKVNFRTFQPPPNYTEKSDYSNNQLFLEDLNNEDNELWVFQTSQGFDSSSLKNKIISLQEETVFQNENHLLEEKSHKISVFNSSVNEFLGYQLLLPSRFNSGLFPVSLPLVGHLKLTECIDNPSYITPVENVVKETEECLPDLRQRYVPFGSDKPSIAINTSKHKHKSKACNYHSTEYTDGSDLSSTKKRVSFKSPLETQERNASIEVENVSHFQLNSHTHDINGICEVTEKEKLHGNSFSQKDSIPNEAKSKKKKKKKKFCSNEYTSTNSCLSREDESLFEAPLISTDSIEKAGNFEQKVDFLNIQTPQKTAMENKLNENYDSQGESRKHATSKKKKKSDKSHENNLSENDTLLMQLHGKNESENIVYFKSNPDLSDKNYHKHAKHKKKKKKSDEHEELSISEKIKFSSMSSLTECNEKKLSIKTIDDSNSENIKYLSEKKKEMQPFAYLDNNSQHKAENVGNWEQDSSFRDDHRSHKVIKKKQLLENDGSQDSIRKHKKSKKKKMSDKLWSNEALSSEAKLSTLNTILTEPQENFQSPYSMAAQDFTKMAVQGELPGNDSFQSDIKHKKSKKKKSLNSNVSTSEEEKLPSVTPLTSSIETILPLVQIDSSSEIKCFPRTDVKTESLISTNNSSKADSICDDKCHTKKKAKKHGHRSISVIRESLNVFEETDQNYQNVGERENESIHNQENASIKKERKKNHSNHIGSNQVFSDESVVSSSFSKDERIKKEESLSIKKHKKKKKSINQWKEETFTGDSSKCRVFEEYENNGTVKEERHSLSVINIKQECLSDGSNESSTKRKKKKIDEQLKHSSLLPDLKNYTVDEFSGNLIKKEIDVNHNCVLLDDREKDNSKHLNANDIKQKFVLSDVKSHKKNKDRKILTHPEASQITIKQEDGHDQTSKLYETDYHQKTTMAIKQEVFSDCDDNLFIKQEHSDRAYAALTKEIKKEIKLDPDDNNFILKKHTKRKRNENSDESYSEDVKNTICTSDCNKSKKLKMQKQNR